MCVSTYYKHINLWQYTRNYTVLKKEYIRLLLISKKQLKMATTTIKTSTSTSRTTKTNPLPSSIISTATTSQAQAQKQEQLTRLERKIAIATEGFIPFIIKKLRRLADNDGVAVKEQVGRQNIETICDYLIAMNAEINPSLMHKRNQMQIICYLSKYHNNQKPFREMTSNAILAYLNTLRRPEASDPNHQWIGTYNLRRIYFIRFFKWLYSPNLNPKDRPYPDVIRNISQLKRLEHTIIKPTDLWNAEDLTLFLRYCPSKRDKAYFTVAMDSSCRRIIEGMSRRPNVSIVLSKALFTSSTRATSHLTAIARLPSSSIIRAVSRLPCSEMSVTTTPAPSHAKVSAVARPIPLPAPVMNATFPSWFFFPSLLIAYTSFQHTFIHFIATLCGIPKYSHIHCLFFCGYVIYR